MQMTWLPNERQTNSIETNVKSFRSSNSKQLCLVNMNPKFNKFHVNRVKRNSRLVCSSKTPLINICPHCYETDFIQNHLCLSLHCSKNHQLRVWKRNRRRSLKKRINHCTFLLFSNHVFLHVSDAEHDTKKK